MGKLKKSIILIVVTCIATCAISLFISKDYSVSTKMSVNVPANFVYNALNNLKLQKDINSMAIHDTSFRLLCTGSVQGEAASCDFTANKYGNGVIRILNSTPMKSIRISEEQKGKADKQYEFQIVQLDLNQTQILSSAQSSSGFISNLWKFIHRWKLRKQLNKNLDNLKVLVLNRYKNKVYNGYNITESALNQRYFISQRSIVDVENINEYYTKNISSLYQTALENNLIIPGMPCGLFYEKNDVKKQYDMAAALPTLAEFNIKNTEATTIPNRQALIVEFKGPRSASDYAYTAIYEYLLDHNLKGNPPIIEEYQTDPVKEPNPEKWTTKIIFYVLPK